MRIKLIAVGRLREEAYEWACAEYARRLAAYARLELVEVRDARIADSQAGLLKEGQALLALLRPGEHAVLLDSGGKQFTSVELADWLENHAVQAPVFIVGSSHGVAPIVRERAQTVWSLSKLTFPHELARVIVLEQLYRAATILAGHPYHHG
ncbi:MAG: 23S rRNA (pseudouridine(1915)-N(3))-methyltransferase RlmH [Aphanocapsa lilacina HA4352-LM1]|nr:23S rRNA (pseudouridine(1915)-N(3))-methyltransferase RlmH [Aphanocapsa lilacina HA4352-LM1]